MSNERAGFPSEFEGKAKLSPSKKPLWKIVACLRAIYPGPSLRVPATDEGRPEIFHLKTPL
jgi:hypothetical protein